MKNLIKLNPEHFVIVNDTPIEENDFYLDDTNRIRKSVTSDPQYWLNRQDYKKITHSTQPIEEIGTPLSSMIFSYLKIKYLPLEKVEEFINSFFTTKTESEYLDDLKSAFNAGVIYGSELGMSKEEAFNDFITSIPRLNKSIWKVEIDNFDNLISL